MCAYNNDITRNILKLTYVFATRSQQNPGQEMSGMSCYAKVSGMVKL